jgi:diacylglycerol kinase family enzyme
MERKKQRIAVVFNSASGPCDCRGSVEKGIAYLRAKGFEVDEKPFPEIPSDIPHFIENISLDDYSILVAVGGDGTANLLASKLVTEEGQKSMAALFVIPAGTFNHFSKHLGIPQNVEEAFEVLVSAERKYIDTAELNGECFINFSSTGVYSKIIRDRIRNEKTGSGRWWSFARSFVKNIIRYQVFYIEITKGGKKTSLKTSFVFVGNNPFIFGLPNVLEERESLNEGVLQLLVAKDCGRFGLFQLFLLLLLRDFEKVQKRFYFDSLCLTSFEISGRKKTFDVGLDGEMKKIRSPLRYHIRPRSLQVLVPRKRQGDEKL